MKKIVVLSYLKSKSKIFIILLGLLLVLLIGAVDYLVLEISISIFYLIPIVLTTWLTDKKSGFL